MNQDIRKRIGLLRKWMLEKGLSAFILTNSDPHLSEYVASHWKSREWISGFNGSAGTVVVTLSEAGLWTDSRYFLQAAEQLDGTGITLYKEMLPETPSIETFLKENLPEGSVVGITGVNFQTSHAENLQNKLSEKNIKLDFQFDPMNDLWLNRPRISCNPPFVYDIRYAGKSCREKITEIRTILENKKHTALLLSSLDEIAWTLNIRGEDIEYNPLVISYLLITTQKTILFILPEKLTPEIISYLEDQAIIVEDYKNIACILSTINTPDIVLDPDKTNYYIYLSVNPGCKIIRESSPVALLKSIRNQQEIEGIYSAMRKDGVALVKFLRWLEDAVLSGKETELSINKRLYHFRSGQELFMGESFSTIAGYGEHGAIVHYSATEKSNAVIYPKGFLLLDSGAQYLDGTTDITRTIALGELTEEEKLDYTLILKGHIALAMAKFPAGTRGAQLDILARLPLWKSKMNYLHGTGHGIGHFLNVHEGPQSIRMNENPVVLHPGMLISNEPGVYKAGRHGVRTENLMLVIPDGEGMYGDYYKFETVTLCPIDKKGIIKEMLNKEEMNWLNNYHRKVYTELIPLLNQEDKEWLEKATEKI